MSDRTPKLSVILVTDTYQTIRPVIERLRKQTAREQLEVVLLAASVEETVPLLAFREEFAAVQTLEAPAHDMAPGRVRGIRAATAPSVFLGETHSYPHPEFAAALIKALEGPWAAVVPCLGNGNPNGALSWAAFLSDYGTWGEGHPAGEISGGPIYNVAYRRDVLLGLEDRLEPAIAYGDELALYFQSKEHRTYFEPGARIDHLNVAPLGHWLRERYLSGLLVAAYRNRRWPLVRRLAYAGGSFLIPFVLVKRLMPGVRRAAVRKPLPTGTTAAIFLSAVLKAAGEALAYLGLAGRGADAQMQEYEMHKLAYAGRGRG